MNFYLIFFEIMLYLPQCIWQEEQKVIAEGEFEQKHFNKLNQYAAQKLVLGFAVCHTLSLANIFNKT